MTAALLQLTGIRKNYQGLRPLRMRSLGVTDGERVSISGLDGAAAELLVNLITGAALPDAGEVLVFGRSTASIATGDEWLGSLDRFGIVSPRGVLLEGSSLEQNLAMPFTLDIDPVMAETSARVATLASECGIAGEWLCVRAGQLPVEIRARAHLARAVALEPSLLLVEHPTADIPEAARGGLAADMVRVCGQRRLAAVVMTNDDGFARAVAPRNLTLEGATGELKPLPSVTRGWFR